MKRSQKRAVRPAIQMLETRRLLAAPVIDAISDITDAPASKPLIIPVTATADTGETLLYSVTSSNPNIIVDIHHGNPWLEIDVTSGTTTYAPLIFQLFQDLTPKTVSIIQGFVNNAFYDGLIFHRIANLGSAAQPAFIVQGGDPKGDGTGGPGFSFEDEFNLNAMFTGKGQLAMANSGSDTNGSQFFITDSPIRSLDFVHTIFGQLVRGFDTLTALTQVPRDSSDKPVTTVTITAAKIVTDNTDAVLTIHCPAGQTGTISLTALDTTAAGTVTATQSFHVTGIADTTNEPPIMVPLVDNMLIAKGHQARIDVAGIDFEDESLVYSGQVTSGQATGEFQGHTAVLTPDPNFVGIVKVTLSVRDKDGNPRSDSETISIGFGDFPLTAATAGTGLIAHLGNAETGLVVARFSDMDPNGKASDFTAQIRWGDGNTATGTVTKAPDGNFTVTGGNTFKKIGTSNFTVIIKDIDGAVATVTGQITIVDALIHPSPAVVVGYAGTALTNVILASFTDDNAKYTATNFTANIDWGDGSAADTGTITANSSGGFFVNGSHTYAVAGNYPVNITIHSTGGGSADTTVIIPIGTPTFFVSAGSDATITEGQTFSQNGGLSDSFGTGFNAVVNYGDGSGFQPLALTGNTFTLSHVYPNNGVFVVTVIITDQAGQIGNDQVTVTVTNTPPVVTPITGTTTAVPQQTVNIGFTVSSPSTSAQAAGFTVTVNWGDSSTPTTVASGGTSASHVYTTHGPYIVTVSATDKDSQVGTATTTITVSDALLETDPVDATKQALFIGGALTASTITVNKVSTGVTATVNSTTSSTFNPTGRIIVLGGAGNDTITIDSLLTGIVEVHGGAGNDSIAGGGGTEVLTGDAGNDTITAGSGRDIIIGGGGNDSLTGGAGGDIFVGGSTSFDANSSQLSLILSEWSRTDATYTAHVDHLKGPAAGLNTGVFLTTSTVTDDNIKDTITGGAGDDLFIANTVTGVPDLVNDKKTTETLLNL